MRSRPLAIGLLALGLIVAGCGGTAAADKSSHPAHGVGSVQKGKATWYGGKFHGHKTASGEIFDKHSMTAAHRTLPFGTIVKVTNLKNGRSVTLRINNRGPYGKGRIIDVSEAAARRLKMVSAGVVPATVEVLKLGKGRKRHKKKRHRRHHKKKSSSKTK